MNQQIKIIVLLLAALSITSAGFAQINWRKPDESIIVMTKARLDSLLTDIANSTRALLAQREPERLAKFNLKSQKPARDRMAFYQEKARNPVSNETRIFQELDRINQRIDRLMMKIISLQTNNNYPNPSGTTIIPNPGGRSPTIIYEQERPVVPNRFRSSGSATARVQDTLSLDLKNLQDEIEALQAQIVALGENPDSTNKKAISSLKERIDRLNIKLEKADRIIEYREQIKINENNSLTAILKNYRQAIYFANDSANLNSAAKALLLQLAQMIKRSDERVIVFVQGYASKTGTAMYNYKLSLRRADAVQDVLVGYGISAGRIEILGHGVNKSHSAPAARRVEISLLIK